MAISQDEVASRGPFLAMAAFFETVIREDNGVLTLVRMIDRITISAIRSRFDGLPSIPVSAHLVVGFRGQALEGSGTVSIHPMKPSGEKLPPKDIPVVYDRSTGVNLNIELGMIADQEGYYWFDVFLDDEFITRTPLEIVFQRGHEIEEVAPEHPAN